MAKILLVEPKKILRQAISLSLFPDHEVKVEEHLTASSVGSLKEYDLLIVDGGALRELGQLTPEFLKAIQGCKTPMLWLDDDESSRPPKREKLQSVKKPIEREAFLSALNGLLSPETAPKGRTASPKAAVEVKKQAGEAEQASLPFIDLVEVVEEGPASKQGKRSQRKSK